MTPRDTFARAEQITLLVLACAAISSFGAAHGQPAAWAFCLPCCISPFWCMRRVSAVVRRGARWTAWTLVGLAGLLSLILMAYPVLLSEQMARALAYLAGYGLALHAALFLLGTPVWPAKETFFPACAGLLVVAAFNPLARIRPLLALAGMCAFVFLWLTARRRTAPRGSLLSTSLVISALGSALLAWTIFLVLPLLQGGIERATVNLFLSATTHYSSLSTESRLGDLRELQLSPRVVMRVWTLSPQKLRGRVFERFDGQSWYARNLSGTPLVAASAEIQRRAAQSGWLQDVPGNLFLLPAEASASGESNTAATKIVQTVFNEGLLVSPANKLLVRAPLDSLRVDPFENLLSPLTAPVQIYGVVHRPAAASSAEETGTPQAPEAELLAVPSDLDPRWLPLAARLFATAQSPAERMRNTVAYVRDAASYSLEVGQFHSRQPVTEFFFEKKRGYCQYFASAAAILLRLEGLPTRYVTGFNVQEFSSAGHHWVVREADAHAWLEVFLPGRGWVEADPTPEAEFAARRQAASSGVLSGLQEWFAASFAEAAIRFRLADWRSMVRWTWQKVREAVRLVFAHTGVLAILLALAVVLAVLLRRWRPGAFRSRSTDLSGVKGLPTAPALNEWIVRLDRFWAAKGFARPASRGLREQLDFIPPEKLSADVRNTCLRIVEAVYRTNFAGLAVPPEALPLLERELARLDQSLRQ